MKITHTTVTVRELTEGYEDNEESGVIGYNGNLDIRPAFQREFVYSPAQQVAVIDTILKGYPLNVFYWGNDPTTPAEHCVIDGQQRTSSICRFVDGEFSIVVNGNTKFFYNLSDENKNKILDYELMIYQCEGNDHEKLEWFRVINTAGSVLTDQELMNAAYTGEWLSDAKKFFSKTGGLAAQAGDKYVKGSPIRQELLQKALNWIVLANKGKYKDNAEYMAAHQYESDASELKQHYQAVIAWAKILFPNPDKKMGLETIDWGKMYAKYKDKVYNATAMEKEYKKILSENEYKSQNKTGSGIVKYLITGEEKYLNRRAFTDVQKASQYAAQDGVCASCNEAFDLDDMEGDHIKPWSKGGMTTDDNLQMLCKPCNGTKSSN